MYEHYLHQCIRRTSDGAIIPPDPENTDYQAFKAWENEGNVASPYDPDMVKNAHY
jgi:hypothetical protein